MASRRAAGPRDRPVRPISPYGAHKAACEALTRALRANPWSAGLRPEDLLGLRRRTAAAVFLGLHGAGAGRRGARRQGVGARRKGAGDETRDFIHAADVARRRDPRRGACAGERRRGAATSPAGEETAIRPRRTAAAALGLDLEVPLSGRGDGRGTRRWRADVSRLAPGLRPGDSGSELPRLADWIAAQHAGAPARRPERVAASLPPASRRRRSTSAATSPGTPPPAGA